MVAVELRNAEKEAIAAVRRRQARMDNKLSLAEKEEQLAAGITGPPCPFCLSRQTTALTSGWPNDLSTTGFWECNNCDESGVFTADGLHWAPEGER